MASRTNPQRGPGYGRFCLGGRLVLAHRFSWEIHYGSVPRGLRVLHRCDNPLCVNPSHLRVGTQADNIREMIEKGRHVASPGDRNGSCLHPESRPRGERHASARLTERDVRLIRSSMEPAAVLARQLGITPQAVSAVRARKTWRHVA